MRSKYIVPALSSIPGTPLQASDFFGGADRGSYLRASLALLNGDVLSQRWVFDIWPPGIPLINALFLNFNQDIRQLGYIYFLIEGTLWVMLFFKLIRLSQNKKFLSSTIILFSSLLLLNKDIIYRVFLQPLFNADSIGNLLGLIGLIYWLNYLRHATKIELYKAIFIWTLASYFRLTWYTFIFATILVVLLVNLKSGFKKNLKDTSKQILISLLIVIILTLPWRLFAFSKLDINPLKWTQFQAVILLEQWYPKSVWKDTWIANTGAYPLCILDQETCSKVENLRETKGYIANSQIYKLTIKTWITKFPQLVNYEVPYIIRGWLSPPENFTPDTKLHFTFYNILSLIGWLFIVLKFISDRYVRLKYWIPLLAFLSVHVFFLIFFHTENRYLFVYSFLPFILIPYFVNFRSEK